MLDVSSICSGQGNLPIREWLGRQNGREVHEVRLADLRDAFPIRGGGLDLSHVELLTQASEQSLPAIVVHQSTMRIIDGLHRVQAARMKKATGITAEYFNGTDGEAHALGVFLNVGHGLPLTRSDRAAAARVVLSYHPEWSDRFVGRMAGLAHGTVSAIRRSGGEPGDLGGRLGIDGKVRPVDVDAGRLRAAQLLADSPELSLREVGKRAGISASTAGDVKARIGRGRHPVPKRERPAEHKTRAPVSGERLCDVAAGVHGAGRPADTQQNGRPVELFSAPMPTVLLERLQKDPAVRFSETGRQLIRQLAATNDSFSRLQLSASAVPAHCSTTLAQIARRYAAAWKMLAEQVEARTIDDGQGPVKHVT